MAKGYIGGIPCKAYVGGTKIKAGYMGASRVYSAGSTVTYMVDKGVSYVEEVDSGASCLSPATFVPSRAGWHFVGWRSDGAAVENVYGTLVRGDTRVVLYAVFSQPVVVTYHNGDSNSNETKNRYYNNATISNPAFVGTQVALSGWKPRGWSTDPSGNGGIVYANGAVFSRDSSITLYGMYEQTITLSYHGNGATGGSNNAQTGIRYYNSNGNVVNPTFVVQTSAFVRTGFAFSHWALNQGARYDPGMAVTLDASAAMYAVWIAAAYYAYQNGMPNAAMGISNPVVNDSRPGAGRFFEGPSIENAYSIAGVVASVGNAAGESGPNYGACTAYIPTNGLSNVHIEMGTHVYKDNGGIGTPHCSIYGRNAAGTDTILGTGSSGFYDSGIYNYNVSGYTHIKVAFGCSCAGGSSGLDKKFFVGIKEIRFS